VNGGAIARPNRQSSKIVRKSEIANRQSKIAKQSPITNQKSEIAGICQRSSKLCHGVQRRGEAA
jgi:hypothetical protein